MNIGQELKAWRTLNSLTQTQVGELLGVGDGRNSTIEHGNQGRALQAKMLRKIKKLLKTRKQPEQVPAPEPVFEIRYDDTNAYFPTYIAGNPVYDRIIIAAHAFRCAHAAAYPATRPTTLEDALVLEVALARYKLAQFHLEQACLEIDAS